MGKVYNRPGTNVIIVEDNSGRLVWSSERPPVNLLPQANWLSTVRAIDFPDFSKFANYGYQRIVNPDGPRPPWAISGSGDACQTVTMIDAPQEWSGGDIVIGTVPAGVNYIDVRVRVARTKAPSNFLDQPVPQLISPGQWVHLPGGSGLIEANTVWRRLFDIVLSGSNILLRRKQSVAAIPANAVSRYGGIYANAALNGDPDSGADTARWGWVASHSSGFQGTQRNGHPAALIEVKQFSSNNGANVPTRGAKHPLRERACSISISQDFSSSYSAEIQIRPGYIAN